MPVNHERYFDKRAARYDARLGRDRWPRNQEKKAAFVKEALGERVGLLVDVGCGTGQMLDLLLRAGACARCVGVDPAAAMLERAARRLEPHGDRVKLSTDSAEHLNVPSESADAVIGIDLLHHLENVPASLAEFRRILRPGGKVVFLESNVRFPATLVIGLASREERGMFRTTPGYLRRILDEAGFDQIAVDQPPLFTPPGPTPLVPLFDVLDRALVRLPLIRRGAIFYRATARVAVL